MNINKLGIDVSATRNRTETVRQNPLWQTLRGVGTLRQFLNRSILVAVGGDRVRLKLTEYSREKITFEASGLPIDKETFIEPPYHSERATTAYGEKNGKMLLTVMSDRTGLQYLSGYDKEPVDLEPLAPGQTELNRRWEVTEPKWEGSGKYYLHIFRVNKFDLQRLVSGYLAVVDLA